MIKFFRCLIYPVLLIILSFFAIRPLFVPGFFPMHDDTQPARVYEMAKSLSSGQFPVRWVPDLGYGYGYPLFNFYAPFPYYFGAFFYLLGFDIFSATKLMFAVGILLSGITMYFLGKEFAGELAGIVSAMLYLYAPYHAVNIYVRGAVGEFYAMGFLPLILLGLIKIIKYTEKRENSKELKVGFAITSLALTATILSHNILGMITGYFLIFGLIFFSLFFLFFFCYKRKVIFPKKRFKVLLFAILFGLGLSAFFTLPALVEKKYTKVDTLTTGGSDFRQHFVYLDQLWNSSWGYAGSAEGRVDGMSFKIGKLHLGLGVLGFLSVLYLYRKKRLGYFQFAVFIFQLLIFFISVFLMLEISKFIWEVLPGFSYIQYPWRFLNFALLALSLFSTYFFLLGNKTTRFIFFVTIIFLVLWFNAKYFTPREFISVKPEDYLTSENLYYKISKISDEYLPKNFLIPKDYQDVPSEKISFSKNFIIENKHESVTKFVYTINVLKKTEIFVNISYFPSWQASLNGQKIYIEEFQGKMRLLIPEGKHILMLEFKNTTVQTLSNIISLFSSFLLLYVLLFWKGKFSWLSKVL